MKKKKQVDRIVQREKTRGHERAEAEKSSERQEDRREEKRERRGIRFLEKWFLQARTPASQDQT